MTRRALARSLAIATVLVVAACGGTTSGGTGKTSASVAIVPGGPHPYFEPMRQAIVDAKTDFSLSKGTFQVPTDWKQDLQNQLLTSLAAQGYDGFGIFPTDGNAANGIVSQLAAKNYPVMAVGGCVAEPTKTTFCIATDVGNSAYTGAKAAIAAMGGKGVLLHGTGLLTDPNTVLRVDAVKKAVAETNGAVTLITITDIDKDAQTADTAINQALATHKDITGIITTAYNPTVAGPRRCGPSATRKSRWSVSTTTPSCCRRWRTASSSAPWVRIRTARLTSPLTPSIRSTRAARRRAAQPTSSIPERC